MGTAIVLFNRDLRVRDNPALAAAAKAERAVPLFVLDQKLLSSRFAAPNRVAFMLEALRDLDHSLRHAGGRLYLRQGDPVNEAISAARECGATELHVSADWSAYARRREERLHSACEEGRIAFRAHPGTTIVVPGTVTPAGGDHFKVFTPFHRAWEEVPLRPRAARPRKLTLPSQLGVGRLPAVKSLLRDGPSPERATGGEGEGLRLMRAFLRDDLADYEAQHDDLPGDATSGLSPYLRFGCISPLELLNEARSRPGGAAYARQLCWRDFHHQVLAAFPALPRRDYRPKGDRWSRSQRTFEAWREGRTGYPIVDAAMRQLLGEGRMHNRARMIVASFLTKEPLPRLALGGKPLLGPAQRR
jgi:deoxyribodipyrimidine photo-lyase